MHGQKMKSRKYSIYNSITNNTILRNKFAQKKEHKIYTLKTIKHCQKIEEDTNKWKISHFHRLEDLILLRWQYYSKQSIDSWLYLSKS